MTNHINIGIMSTLSEIEQLKNNIEMRDALISALDKAEKKIYILEEELNSNKLFDNIDSSWENDIKKIIKDMSTQDAQEFLFEQLRQANKKQSVLQNNIYLIEDRENRLEIKLRQVTEERDNYKMTIYNDN